MPDIHYVRTTTKNEIVKNSGKNDEPLINHYTLFVVCLNFNKSFKPHKKFFWHFIKKSQSQEIGDKI